MKKLLLALIIIALLVTPAFAQWGGGQYFGTTVLHRDGIAIADEWIASFGTTYNTDSSLQLAGYNAVRADYDVTGADVSIELNLQCSNDSLWVSGATSTVTADTWEIFDLNGCQDYNFYVTTVSASDSITIYLTPFRRY